MLKKGLKMHHMVQKTPWPSGKAKVCNTSIPGPIPGGVSEKEQDTSRCLALFCALLTNLTALTWSESGSEPPPERSGGRTFGWRLRFTGF